jgi:tetratricopeptide (TPR) repeat protein
MTDEAVLDAQWAAWHLLLKSILRLTNEGDHSAAIRLMDDFLRTETDAALRSSALGMRAEVKQESGDLDGALHDLLHAIPLAGDGFSKHVHEFCIAEIYRKHDDLAQVTHWYRTALKTCAESGDFSAGAALDKFLHLQPQMTLPTEDLALCRNVAQQSWKVLGLPDSPDLANLSSVAKQLMAKEAGVSGCHS